MKVLLTLDFPPARGGIQQYLYSLVERGYGANDYVLVASTRQPKPTSLKLSARTEYSSFPLSPWYPKLSLLSVAARYFMLTRGSTGVETECGNIYAACIPWLMGRPYAVYTYGTELLGLRGRSPKSFFLRTLIRGASRIFVLGAYTRQLLERAGIHGTTVVVPHRIDIGEPDVAAALAERERPSGDVPFRILMVGRCVPHKGHHILLQAARLFPGDFEWRITLVGDGPRREYLQKLARELGMAEKVSFKWGLSPDELNREYRHADAFVLPSVETRRGTEGFGIVLLEAMSYALPIVASRCGGIPEVVGDSAALVPQNDPSALADAIARVGGDPGFRYDLSSRGVRNLLENHVWRT